MTEHYKHAKTMHFLFSEGLQNDDRMMPDELCFDGKTVAITEKRDGEGTNWYNNGYHARSMMGGHHPSRSWAKAEHCRVQNEIPEGWKIYGENLYSKKAIYYEDLITYFEVIFIWDEDKNSLSLEEELKWCDKLGLIHVPILEILTIKGNDFSKIKEWSEKIIGEGKEGIVARNIEPFNFKDFQYNVAKTVRKGHVQPDESHWMSRPVEPNKLKICL